MIRKCIVPGCHNHSENGKRLSFHLFPTDETLRQIWIDWIHSLPIDDDSDLPDDFEEGHVCSAHFSPEDDYVDGEDLDEYKPRNNLSIPSIHLPSAAASTSRQAPEESNITEEENTVDTVNHYGENNGETEPEPDTEAEGMSEAAEPMEEPSDEEDEMPLQARIKEDRMSDYDPDEDMEEDDDDDPSFDPSNPATKAIKPVTGGRGRKSTRYSESRSTRSKEPKAKAPPKETGRKNKRKSQPKKVTKKPTKRELKLREIEYDSEDPEEENNQNRSNKQKTPSAPAVPEIPESIMLSLNTSNSRITALTEEIENCHKIIKEKNELLNKLNLNINELSSKLKYFTQSEFSIKLTSVITEASKGDTRAVYLLDQIRKYNSVAASNTVYVALPSTSAALSTAAAQSVIQEQIQQQQQQQTSQSTSAALSTAAAQSVIQEQIQQQQQQQTSQSAALSTAAAQSVIQEQIQQQQQQQTSQRSSSSHSNHNAAHQQQHSSQQSQQAQQQAAAQQQAQQQAAAAAAQQQAVAAAAAAVNNNALYNQYQQSLAAQQLQLPFQTFTADHLAYHNQRFQ
ncbi:hypothetical protein M8J76_001299 [Diaphorina citri]|nr:hypothetical protein M8J76_001299 [Diaphorina citri]